MRLYWALSRISDTYTIPDGEYDNVRTNCEKLDLSGLEAMDRDYEKKPEDDIYFELSQSMSRGADGADGIGTRHDVLSQFLFEDVRLVPHPQLDLNRLFTPEEKLLLYHRAGGVCQLDYEGAPCGRSIDFDEAVVDTELVRDVGDVGTFGDEVAGVAVR